MSAMLILFMVSAMQVGRLPCEFLPTLFPPISHDHFSYRYNTNWNQYADVIDSILSQYNISVKYQGATFSGVLSFFEYLPTYIDLNHERLSSISVHNYGECNGDLSTLMTSAIYPRNPAPYGLQNATNYGLEYWMGETGSVACCCWLNVSDTFASALWGVDWIFRTAQLGYKAMSFHGVGAGGQGATVVFPPWDLGPPPIIRPLYYAMLAAARTFAGPNAYIWPEGNPNLNVTSDQPMVSVFSTLDAGNGLRKVIVNHRNITPGLPDALVSITFSQGNYYANALLYFLLAPSPLSKFGVTLAGQTFDGTLDGTIQGNQTTYTISSTGNNTWQFTMQAASAAFITFCPLSNPMPCGGQPPSTSASGRSSPSLLKLLLPLLSIRGEVEK